MKKIQEWSSKDTRNAIVLPPEVMERLKYKVLIERLNGRRPTICWCESIEYEPPRESFICDKCWNKKWPFQKNLFGNKLTLRFVLFDTSDRHEGSTLLARRTL